MKMSKKIIVGLALAVVLFGGSIFSAQAADRFDAAGCPSPSTRTTPQPMGSPGAY